MMMMMRVALVSMLMVVMRVVAVQHNYGDALTKSILFFEGQRSGKLPPTQRLTWRKDSALRDGSDNGIDLVGGYYDAGDNIKFNFPMAFTTTMLAWSVIDFGEFMGQDLQHALEAIQWGTDYFLKATSIEGKVYVQVADPYGDHNCWERPEDMDTPRTSVSINETHPGSEVSAEIAAALAASSIVFKASDPKYSALLLQRAQMVFEFANKFQGSYNDSLAYYVCPFYCDFNGYQDELVWGAAWLYKATESPNYWNYVKENIQKLAGPVTEFGWDDKIGGINVLASKIVLNEPSQSSPFVSHADALVCSILPESPTKSVKYSPGGLLFKSGGSNMQHPTALGFLLLAYARYLNDAKRVIHCGNVVAAPSRLIEVVKGQVDYILGENPLKLSYMVGYGKKFPQRIHHRGSTLPCIAQHPQHIACHDGKPFFQSPNANPNILTGAIVGGPYPNDTYGDSRADFVHSEPTTYINAPFVGVLAYFKAFPTSYEFPNVGSQFNS